MPRTETIGFGSLHALALLLVLGVAGCTAKGPEDRLADYLARLARPLDTAPGKPSPPIIDAPPRAATLQLPIERGSIDGFDFLKLRGCALQQTVARRNSSLGRVAPPSQRLLLELEFLSLVDDCIAYQRERDQQELAALLADSAALKRRQLPALLFNATLGNEEYRNLWRGPQLPADYPAATSSLVVDALARISGAGRRWLGGDYHADGQAFELRLGDIATGDGGELLAALALQASYLERGSTLLRERAQQSPLCSDARRPRAANVLRTVATKYFVGEVQPWSATVNQRAHDLLPPIRELESLLDTVLPAPYREWRDARDAALQAWSAAPRKHVGALQALLGSCFREFAAPVNREPPRDRESE